MKSDKMVEVDYEHHVHGESWPACGLMIFLTVTNKSATARIQLSILPRSSPRVSYLFSHRESGGVKIEFIYP